MKDRRPGLGSLRPTEWRPSGQSEPVVPSESKVRVSQVHGLRTDCMRGGWAGVPRGHSISGSEARGHGRGKH